MRELLREKARLYREAHRDELRARQRAYQAAHPEKRAAWRSDPRVKDNIASHNRKRRYGITDDEYQSMLNRQGGVCALCGKPETAVGRTRLAVDHEHGSGRPRGLLCIGCNLSLGYYERGWKSRLDPDVVERYLKGVVVMSSWIKVSSSEDGSWHIVEETTDDQGFTVLGTLCGLKPRNFDVRSERPGNEASCENCLRILTKD